MWTSSSLLLHRSTCSFATNYAYRRTVQKCRNRASPTAVSSSNTRYLATAVAELEDDEPFRPPPPGSRLAALRQRLQHEKKDSLTPDKKKPTVTNWSKSKVKPSEPPIATKETTTTTTAKSTTISSSTATTTTTDSTKRKEESIEEMLAKLELLPPIPHPADMLLDNHNRQHSYLRISLAERCNLRCLYCMPPEGVPLQSNDKLLNKDEILQLSQLFVDAGVDKVRMTGGEPLLRHDLVDIVQGLSNMGVTQIGMTTNGVTLAKKIPALKAAGLTHINISLDTLDADKFTTLTRRPAFHKVMKSIEVACEYYGHGDANNQREAGAIKINNVVMKDCNEHEIQDFVNLTKQYPMDVRFIEWMPFNDNGWNQNRFVSYQDMLNQLAPMDLQRVSDGPNDTTKWWQLPLSDGSSNIRRSSESEIHGSTANNGHLQSESRPYEQRLGRVGFITSMSEHFCDTCNRLRLTADGQIKVCLFGSSEISLRDAMRMGVPKEQMQKLIHYALSKKHAALGGHGSAQGIANANDNRPMTLIGG